MKEPNKTSRRAFLAGSVMALGGAVLAQTESAPKTLPDWEEGFLDIHHISTGRGDAAFLILPDGTTLMIDAGDLGEARPPETMMPHVPDESRSPGEWLAEYIRHFSRPLGRSKPLLDYVFLTHFHADHIGCKQADTPSAHGYALSGISMLAEHVDIGKLVDRGYPNYDFPSRAATEKSNTAFFGDYIKFVEYQKETRKTAFEGFVAGSDSQFVLKNAPKKFADFQVRNIYVNGEIWTGEGVNTTTLLPKEIVFDENSYCGAIHLSYGPFRYFSGGDIPGYGKRDVETAVSKLLGPVNVLNLNHHGYKDSINPAFLSSLKPRVMVVPVWDKYHPHVETLARMTDKSIYAEDRSIFSTGMFPGLEEQLAGGSRHFKLDGHVVIRVGRDKTKYDVFVLDNRSKNYEVKLAESYGS